MTKEEIEEVLLRYINHIIDIEGTDFISEPYLYGANFTGKEKIYLRGLSISNQKQKNVNPNFQINEYGDDDFATPPPLPPITTQRKDDEQRNKER